MTTSADLRIGVLGAAAIAPAAIVRPARAVEGVRVTAIAARDRRRAEAFATRHGIDRVHDDYAAVLDDPDIDAVYIPVPNGLHGAWTIRAIQAHKHVLCEKPFTASAAEARAVADVAHRSDRVVMEAFHWRYHPLNQRLLAAVAAGDLGSITSVRGTFCFPLLKRGDIRWSRTLAGGSLMDAGCYPVNMVRAVMTAAGAGEPTVTGATAAFTGQGVDRALRGRMRWSGTESDGSPGDTDGAIRCGMFDPLHPVDIRLQVVGTDGSVTVRNPLAPQLFGHAVYRRDGARRVDRAERTPSYTYQLEVFRDAVRDGAPFASTVDDAIANMAVIDALYDAAGVTPHTPTPLDA